MTVSRGREFLALPGPTTVPHEVLQAMHRPAVDIYGEELTAVTDSCLEDLRRVFRTEQGRTYIYIANGHGAWEAALSNVLSRGDKVLVLESGRFAVGWGEMAEALGVEVEVLAEQPQRAVSPEALEARLRADRAGEIKAILVVQVDTASGVVNDIAALGKAIDTSGHGALFMVDVIASLGSMPFEMDGWGIDVAVAGAQKGLMMTPGLSFIGASAAALAAHADAGLRTRYWDWTAREGELHYMKYCGTPPVHLLFGLRKVPRHAVRRRPGKRLPSPRAPGRCDPGSSRALAGCGGSRLQYPRAVGTLADGDCDPHGRSPAEPACSTGAGRSAT